MADNKRIFTHINGYGDNTKQIECHASGINYLRYHNGAKVPTEHYDLKECLRMVKNGFWIEINGE